MWTLDAVLGIGGGLVVLVFVTRFLLGKLRMRELDRDFSMELSCAGDRALTVAAKAARGVMWSLDFTDNGLRTRHIVANNVIHVAISDHPVRAGRCLVSVWTRYRWADDSLFFLRPRAYLDTKRKRDRVIRMLSPYRVSTGRDAITT